MTVAADCRDVAWHIALQRVNPIDLGQIEVVATDLAWLSSGPSVDDVLTLAAPRGWQSRLVVIVAEAFGFMWAPATLDRTSSLGTVSHETKMAFPTPSVSAGSAGCSRELGAAVGAEMDGCTDTLSSLSPTRLASYRCWGDLIAAVRTVIRTCFKTSAALLHSNTGSGTATDNANTSCILSHLGSSRLLNGYSVTRIGGYV